MEDQDITRLQDDDEGDFEAAVRQRAPASRRAVVAASFTPTNFALVAEAAQQRGHSLTVFIGEAAVNRARA